MYVMVEKKTFS